jgi:uncharacterized membrane protein YfcA
LTMDCRLWTFNAMELIGYGVSILIGVVLGLMGGGGSILSIPVLVYLFGVEPVLATAYSLFIVGTTSLVAAIPKYKEHLVNLNTGFLFGIPSIVSMFITRKWIVPALADPLLSFQNFTLSKGGFVLGLFAVLMVLASVSMIRGNQQKSHPRLVAVVKWHWVVLQGILIGFLTGLVGAGGGFLIIPALVLLTGLNIKIAVGTSLFIIAINSLMGFAGDLLTHPMDWPLLLKITALAIVGTFIGNRFSRKISQEKLKKGFGWFTLVVGAWILLKEFVLK